MQPDLFAINWDTLGEALAVVVVLSIFVERALSLLFEHRKFIEKFKEASLKALVGIVTLQPRDGILWAHPAPNAKGFTEVKPLDGLRINSPFCGSGGVICAVPTPPTRIRLR